MSAIANSCACGLRSRQSGKCRARSRVPPWLPYAKRVKQLSCPLPLRNSLLLQDYNAPVLRCTTDVGKD